jgi:hypothetical protein
MNLTLLQCVLEPIEEVNKTPLDELAAAAAPHRLLLMMVGIDIKGLFSRLVFSACSGFIYFLSWFYYIELL